MKLIYVTTHQISNLVPLFRELGKKDEIKSKIDEIKLMRNISQPIKSKTGGSTFKNPKGQFAASLIEQADCKGLRYGDACVSTKHSNFLINL